VKLNDPRQGSQIVSHERRHVYGSDRLSFKYLQDTVGTYVENRIVFRLTMQNCFSNGHVAIALFFRRRLVGMRIHTDTCVLATAIFSLHVRVCKNRTDVLCFGGKYRNCPLVAAKQIFVEK
jgi:hypothetical protein